MGDGEDGQMLVEWKREGKKKKISGWKRKKKIKKRKKIVLF